MAKETLIFTDSDMLELAEQARVKNLADPNIQQILRRVSLAGFGGSVLDAAIDACKGTEDEDIRMTILANAAIMITE